MRPRKNRLKGPRIDLREERGAVLAHLQGSRDRVSGWDGIEMRSLEAVSECEYFRMTRQFLKRSKQKPMMDKGLAFLSRAQKQLRRAKE